MCPAYERLLGSCFVVIVIVIVVAVRGGEGGEGEERRYARERQHHALVTGSKKVRKMDT